MKVVALISGGKDSTYNMMQCIAAGHEIVALANLLPKDKTEVDSFMYQSVGFEAVELIATAMDLPLFRKETSGKAKRQEKLYVKTENDEVEDLFELLLDIKKIVNFEAVAVGAILSDYQRLRVENVCNRLNVISLAYLWQRNQKELLDEMISCDVDAIIIKVAALGLDHSHLGRSLISMKPHLHKMHEKYGLNICGEGGEYETFTLDCPLFKSKIVILDSEIIIHSDDSIAPVGYLKLNNVKLENKLSLLSLKERLQSLPLKDSNGYITDEGEDVKDLDEKDIDSDLDSDLANENTTIVEPMTITLSLAEQSFSVKKASNGWMCIGGIRGETMEKAVFDLKSCLNMYNYELSDICSILICINDMKQFTEINKCYISYFNFPNPPVRACVEVPLTQEYPIVIEAIAWKSSDEIISDPPLERLSLHVQSRSHWAPANIGPYSQGVKIGEFMYLAGQIGMIPGTLQIVGGGVKPQCRLALRHVERLLKALDPNVNLRNVVQGVCYVTNVSTIPLVKKLWEEKTNNAIVDYVVVSKLPLNAVVEWHVWAHRSNHLFEYEETGKCIENENWSISIFRRLSNENNITSIVTHLEKTISTEESIFDENIFVEVVDYTIQKLNEGKCDALSITNLKIFYPVSLTSNANKYFNYLDELKQNISLTYTFVPVVYCKNENTFLSISGIRIE